MINKKTIFSVFLILPLICKYEISYGSEFNPEVYNGIRNYFFVEKVVKDSPAYNAGIRAQDRIVELENEKRMLSCIKNINPVIQNKEHINVFGMYLLSKT